MAKTKVLITVKTYPTLSNKYGELVCTAGFLEDGSWIRIYPIKFREKPFHEQYKKYQWIEIDLVRNSKDYRLESYRPYSHDTQIEVVGNIPSDKKSWDNRRKYVLNNVYNNLESLIQDSKDNTKYTSLAVFKPTKVIDFTYEEVERDWDREKVQQFNQFNIFENVSDGIQKIVKKLPYKFSYIFEDINGKRSKLMIEDWEVGQLFWNCLSKQQNEQKACVQVKEKYLDDFAKTKDLHFFLGTTQQHHLTSKNPFIIIGTFHPKHIEQLSLF